MLLIFAAAKLAVAAVLKESFPTWQPNIKLKA